MVKLAFTKMHGLGNDFIVFDAPASGAPGPAALRGLANRHTGIGFDQALMLETPTSPDLAGHYRIFNADGSEVSQCGNGARCVARVAWEKLGRPSGELRLSCPAGTVTAQVGQDGLVTVGMGEPDFEPASLPFLAGERAGPWPLDLSGRHLEFEVASMGNPHAVIRVPSVAMAPVAEAGARLGRDRRFPEGVNVGFMEVRHDAGIALRVHERGVGETLACGTGACAAVAVGRRRGWLGSRVEVELPGGRLVVEWQGAGHEVWMTGPAEKTFEGFIEL